MGRPSAEALLISSMINNLDVEAAAQYGVSSRHIVGYADEFNWCLNYLATYGEQPSKSAFLYVFPEFPFVDHYDIRAASDMVLKRFFSGKMTQAMVSATDMLRAGDLTEAWALLAASEPKMTSAKPSNLVTDLNFFDYYDQPQLGIDVPWRTLQDATGGIRPGNLWYLAGRPGQGKTAHLGEFAVKAMLDGCKVLYYSLEMTEMELRARIHSRLATQFGYEGITTSEILSRRIDILKYKQFVTELPDKLDGKMDIHTPKDGAVSPSVIGSRCEDYDLVVLDYIGLARSDDGTPAVKDWRVAAEISNSLKQIALRNQTPILAASQINREGDTGESPPKLRNLSQSDALAQDGDVVITLRAKPRNVVTAFSLEKNRHGPSGGKFYSQFDPDRGLYKELDADTAELLVLDAEVAA